jgi:putative flippase GtrA
MGRLRSLASHPVTASGIRYGIVGVIVAVVYFGIPVALSGGAGVPIQVAIPIAYLIAVTLHFNLQRHFVFRHVSEFALTRREQVGRYIMMGAVQYPTTALATALLPKLLGLSASAAFVLVTLTISSTVFLTLRTQIFHAGEEIRDDSHPASAGDRSGGELEVAEQELPGGAGGVGERQPDPIEAQMHNDWYADVPAEQRHGHGPAARGADADHKL